MALESSVKPRIIAILAVVGAITAAYYKGDLLACLGISYYLLCIAALVLKHPRAGLLLLGAVGVHVTLVIYSLLRWQVFNITPCHFCFLAAGCALVAAVVYYRPRFAVFPVTVIIAGFYLWPGIFWTNQVQVSAPVVVEAADVNEPATAWTEVDSTPVTADQDKANSAPIVSTVKNVPKAAAVAKTYETVQLSKPIQETTPDPITSSPTSPTTPTAEPTKPAPPPGG